MERCIREEKLIISKRYPLPSTLSQGSSLSLGLGLGLGLGHSSMDADG
jgi:hypothetical protein